jgi:hypothetical protein
MSKRQVGRKTKRASRRKAVLAKRRGARMRVVEDLEEAMGIGKNLAYEVAKQVGVKVGRRWLIPPARYEQVLAGEIAITLPQKI